MELKLDDEFYDSMSCCDHRIAAILEKNGMLKIANVGDCGLKLIRGGKQ